MSMIGIVGGGQMGAGIAELAATHGFQVAVIEMTDSTCAAARARVESSLYRAVFAGKRSTEEARQTLHRIRFDTDWRLLADADTIVEAVPEDISIKQQVFEQLNECTNADALLATNTSSLPITRIAAASHRPEQVVGLHFFQPVPVMRLIEVIPGLRTSATATERALALAQTLQCTVIRSQDRAGFVVNGLLMPYLMSAVRMLESGLATAEDIDKGMELGCRHPMGPLALADFIGLDTCLAIAESLVAEYREAHFAAPPLLRRMVESGQLGRKSGQGFYSY